MAARRPRAALDAGPHRHARTRRRQRGGRGHSYTYRATTCPRPGSTRPRPGRPRPARPRPPRPRTPPACAGRPPERFRPRPPSPVPRPPPEPTAAPSCATRPGPRAAAHADQPSAISSIARRRTSPGDPHTTRHIDHSSEPVMVQPPPDTTLHSRVQSAPLGKKAARSARSPLDPRDRRVTREIVCQGYVLTGYPAISPRRRSPTPGVAVPRTSCATRTSPTSDVRRSPGRPRLGCALRTTRHIDHFSELVMV